MSRRVGIVDSSVLTADVSGADIVVTKTRQLTVIPIQIDLEQSFWSQLFESTNLRFLISDSEPFVVIPPPGVDNVEPFIRYRD